jgi:alpha-D-xyloside xylohydrolase
MLVRDGTVIPQIKLAQSTMQMDWSNLELAAFSKGASAHGLVCLPSDNILHEVAVTSQGGMLKLAADPLAGKVTWKIHSYTDR